MNEISLKWQVKLLKLVEKVLDEVHEILTAENKPTRIYVAYKESTKESYAEFRLLRHNDSLPEGFQLVTGAHVPIDQTKEQNTHWLLSLLQRLPVLPSNDEFC
jgi:hypothetical protein